MQEGTRRHHYAGVGMYRVTPREGKPDARTTTAAGFASGTGPIAAEAAGRSRLEGHVDRRMAERKRASSVAHLGDYTCL